MEPLDINEIQVSYDFLGSAENSFPSLLSVFRELGNYFRLNYVIKKKYANEALQDIIKTTFQLNLMYIEVK